MRIMSAVIVSAACAAAVGRADDDRVDDDPAAAVVRQEGNAIDLEANFDANVFGQNGGLVIQGGGIRLRNRVSPTGAVEEGQEPAAVVRLRRLGQEKLDRVDRLCKLSEAQRTRLELAVESDTRQLAQEIDATRSRYAGVVANFAQPEGQKKWQEFQHDMQRCRVLMQNAFDSGSLFTAALAESLDDSQRSVLVQETRARRSFLWRSMVKPVLAKMDETLGLTGPQHGAIEAALLATEPRLKLDPSPGRQNTHAQQMLVYLQLSQADSKAIRSQLSDRQWQALSMLMNQGKAMKSWLDQQGLVEPGN